MAATPHSRGTPLGNDSPAPSAGPGVDAKGVPAVVDPSENVKALTEAAVKRLDDLRELSVSHLKEMADIRDKHSTELRHAEAARIDQLRDAEAKRIDAIRAVDAAQVTRAAEVQAQAALALAAQVATSAETLRSQVAAAATAGTIALNNALEPMQKRIDDLTRAQYEAQGQKTPDLAMAPILEAIRGLQDAQNQNVGQKQQVVERRLSNAGIFGTIAAAATALGLLITLILLITNGSPS